MALLSSLIISCAAPYSETPISTNFKTTEQNKLQAGHHWQVIANDMAKSISKKVSTSKSVYINVNEEKSQFNRAFRTLLISSLVNQGVKVMKYSDLASVNIDIDVQVVEFSKDREKTNKNIGLPTALTAGLWVVRDLAMHHSATTTAVALTGSTAIGIDIYNWFYSKFTSGEIPQNEIIVTINSFENEQYLSSISNIYYTSDTDEGLYASILQGKSISLVGDR